jgi:hypothetical protein
MTLALLLAIRNREEWNGCVPIAQLTKGGFRENFIEETSMHLHQSRRYELLQQLLLQRLVSKWKILTLENLHPQLYSWIGEKFHRDTFAPFKTASDNKTSVYSL